MLTPLGLMALAPTPDAVFAPVSVNKIPDELIGLSYDRDDPVVNMVYDSRWNGVHIYVRGGEEQAWLLDLNTGGFHRMEVGSYPFVVDEFADFITESTSGVLLGRFDGIKTYDRFATETINGSLVIGPVKISNSTHTASKIVNAKVTFARDTPTGSGTLQIATGIDGQDAVNRLLKGEEQYSIPISALANNNGICFPSIVGHAAVFAFSTETGDLAIEEITCTIEQMGRISFTRTPQIAIEGEASEFTGAFIDLDTSIWAGYSDATVQAGPTSDLPEYTHFLDLSRMPQTWWDEVATPNGEDVRVSNEFDDQVPSMVIDFDLSNQEGMLAFRMNQTVTPRSVRVWIGNVNAATPSASSTFGSDNVFDSDWRGFWPDGAGNSNVTSFGDNTADSNEGGGVSGALAAVYGAEDGPMGANATDFDLGNDTFWQVAGWIASQGLGSQTAWTLVAAFKRNAEVSGTESIFGLKGAAFHRQDLVVAESANQAQTFHTAFDGGSDDTAVKLGTTEPRPVWIHHAGVVVSDTSRIAYVEGLGGTANTATTSPTLLHLIAGATLFPANGHVAMLQVHTIARDAVWINYQHDMLDQSTFWGTIGAFQLQNTITPPTLDTDACPSGQVAYTEAVANTAGYAVATAADPTDGSVNDFTHLVDLTLMPAGWWAATALSSGQDIRVTDVSNNHLPFDLIEFDDVAETGLLVFKRTEAEGGPLAVRVWVGNASATAVPVCSAYGRYLAYDTDWRGFWPSGSGTDRTQYLNAMTSVGTPTVGTINSPVGSPATTYDNDLSTAQYATATNKVPTAGPFTIMASVVHPAGQVHKDVVISSVQDTTSRSGVLLRTRPSSTPARLTTRNPFGSEASAANTETIVATTEWFQAGTAFGNHTRISYVNANTGSSSGGQATIVLSGLDTIVIGAEMGTPFVRGFYGDISLVGLHTKGRGEDWLNYWNKSLDQATFWGTWVWNASSTQL